ncbi:hypothetical protein HID58_055799, partial [Brassica napus]
QSNRRRSSSFCNRHPSAKPSSGFCASCLRERLVTIEAQSSSPAAVQPPELRRIRSHSVRNASAASVSEQSRRRSCDARSSASSLHDLFVDDDEERLDLSIRKPLVPDLKEEEEEEEDYYDGEDMKGFDEGKGRKIVEEESGEHKKTMKEFIDLDWGNQMKKDNDFASIWSRKLKRFSLSHHKEKREDEKLAGRRSCDVDPRLRSFDRSVSSKRQGLLEVDELKAISNAKVSPETVGLFHGAKVLVTEKELRDSNWYSIKNHKPESKELVSRGKICVAASSDRKQYSVELKKPKKKWAKGWNLWGLIQRKNKEIKTEQSLKLERNAVEGSLAESLLKLRRVSKGETNGGVSEKLLKSYSVSARKSCDGVFSGANIVSGFEGGRSSCDGLFHGSINSVEVGRNSCDGVEAKQSQHLHQRKANDGTRENLDNSLLRLYLTPVRSHKASKSGKSRLMS